MSSNRSTLKHQITVAIVDDYNVVVKGLANMFEQYRDRIVVAELVANEPVVDTVDIALYDSFAQPESDEEAISVLVNNPRARRVVFYTWNFHADLIRSARQRGATAIYLDVTGAGVGRGAGGSTRRRNGYQRCSVAGTQHGWT